MLQPELLTAFSEEMEKHAVTVGAIAGGALGSGAGFLASKASENPEESKGERLSRRAASTAVGAGAGALAGAGAQAVGKLTTQGLQAGGRHALGVAQEGAAGYAKKKGREAVVGGAKGVMDRLKNVAMYEPKMQPSFMKGRSVFNMLNRK